MAYVVYELEDVATSSRSDHMVEKSGGEGGGNKIMSLEGESQLMEDVG